MTLFSLKWRGSRERAAHAVEGHREVIEGRDVWRWR